MFRGFIMVLFLFPVFLNAQKSEELEMKISKKPKNWDSLKYHKFETVLIVGLFQQYRTFTNEFDLTGVIADTAKKRFSKHSYMAESNLVGGIVLNYDKFQVAFGTSNQPQTTPGKGYTNMFNVGLNVGDNRWVSENYYRRFKGFYDNNTPSFDSSFKRTGKYYLLPNLVSSLLMTRFMFFDNYKNFSFKSGFGCNYRQLKSSATFIAGGSFSVYQLSNDSAIIPLVARSLYNDYGNMRGFKSVNISCNIGVAATIVIYKAWFISGYFTVGPEQQWRDYDLIENHRKLSYISWSGIGRISMGLNMKKFYILGSVVNDYNVYGLNKFMSFTSNSLTNNFTFGYRFHWKTPALYQKFMKTKLYQLM